MAKVDIIKKIKSISVVFLICISSVYSLSCTSGGSNDDEQNLLLLALLLYINRDPAPNHTYVQRAAIALEAWNIGLVTGVFNSNRGTDTSFELSPPNWMTVANSSCNARGVPGNWQGSTCSLTGGVIGVCITRYYTTGDVGRLVDTTLVMLDTYQDSSASNADKQSVFTHEVGHCLGLRHAEGGGASQCAGVYNNCIMAPTTAGADDPHSAELTAIDAAYNPIAVPPTDRYSQTGGVAIRHWTDPTFTVSSVIGSAMIDSNATQEASSGAPLEGEVEVRVHEYKNDGSYQTKTFDQYMNQIN